MINVYNIKYKHDTIMLNTLEWLGYTKLSQLKSWRTRGLANITIILIKKYYKKYF